MKFKEDTLSTRRIGRMGDTVQNFRIIVPDDAEAEEMFDLFGGKKFETTGKVVRVLANHTQGKYVVSTALVAVAGIGPLVRAHRAERYNPVGFAMGEEIEVIIELALGPKRLDFPPLETVPTRQRHKLLAWAEALSLWVG